MIYKLLDLTLAFAWGRLIDGHLDGLIPVGHHNRPQRTVLGVYLSKEERKDIATIPADIQ